ncbi:MAG: double-strand break repair protein AddB, partial [Alphaproteobacteria bacterium]|nr:double-strand break repair protein AddB [Alphaproteobacteria bacterium]
GPFDPDPVTGFRKRAIETHPQFALKLLLDRMSVHRDEVALWRWGSDHDARAPRSRNISNAMLPPRLTVKWRDLKTADRNLSGVRALELATPAEEAQAIAIALREALETPGRTAALITPDRALATRVSAHLKRWGIAADDSAGRPLAELPPGTLLMAVASVAAERFAPVALLALLKHPLVRSGEERLPWLEQVRRLDLLLRGPRPPAGLAGIDHLLANREPRQESLRAKLREWWPPVRAILAPLEAAFAAAPSLSAQFAALREVVGALTGDAVWAGHQGHQAAAVFADMESAAGEGPKDTDPRSFAYLVEQVLAGVAIRPPQGGHPRIAILGLLEARLQQSDLMILGGLNEGTWPALPSPDPWLAPKIRHELGLPSLERRIGLSAHDLANALGAPQVLITRARRDASAPAIASRFWLRLKAMAGPQWREAQEYRRLAAMIDDPGSHDPVRQPAPCPPVAVRPRDIAVTDVDRLKADPYSFYARKMLGLSALDPVDAEPSAAWRGTAVHDVLEKWAKEDDWDPVKLAPRAMTMLSGADAHPLMRALWQPRLMQAIDWIARQVADDLKAGRKPLLAEKWGRLAIAGVNLSGKADRIDMLPDGSLAIVDYKTGKPPSGKQVAAGYSMQLGLLGLIAEQGEFEGLEKGKTASAFEYWSLGREPKSDSFGYRQSPVDPKGARGKIVTDAFTEEAAAHFIDAVETWLTGNAPFTAKLHPEIPSYGDYDQLMRLEEWYGRAGGQT